MKVCIISKKECWRDENGRWYSSGGFPIQMNAIASLFNETTMLIVEVPPKLGGMPLPPQARMVPLQKPSGEDTFRKISVISRLPLYLSTIARYIREADVVHTPLPGDISILGYFMAILMRKRLIARYGSSWEDNNQTTWMNKLVKKSMGWFAGGTNVMIATGRGDIPPAPGVYWLHATALSNQEIQTTQPDLSRGLRNPANIVYIGRLSVEKGVATLVQALGNLKASGFEPLPHVRLIGDGPERNSLEALAQKLEVSDHISFMGQVDRAEMFGYLAQADFCVQPSLTESSSKAWLDAMALGLPVVAMQVGDAHIVIGENVERGWIAPPGNADALAQLLVKVITSDTDWPALRKRCREYVEGLTIENWADEISRICANQWNVRLSESRQGI